MSTGLTPNMYISTFAICVDFNKTMSTKHSTFITTPSIIHDQDFLFKTFFSKNCYIFLNKALGLVLLF